MQNITLFVSLAPGNGVLRQWEEARDRIRPFMEPRGINIVFTGDPGTVVPDGINPVVLEFQNTDTLIYDIILELSVRFNYRLYDVVVVENSEISLEGERIVSLDNVIHFGSEDKILQLRKKMEELAPFDQEGVQVPLLRKQLTFLEIMFLNYDFLKRLKGHSSNPLIDEYVYSCCLSAYQTFFNCNLCHEEGVEKGESCFVKALERCSAIDDTVAELHILKFYAEFLVLNEKYGKACDLLERYFSLYEKTDACTIPAMEHHKVCCLNYLASVQCALKEYETSVETFKQTVAASQLYFGKNHPDTISYLNTCSSVMEFNARFSDAIEASLQILDMTEDIYGKDNMRYATSLNNIGYYYYFNAVYEKAIKYYTMAKNILEKLPGDHDYLLYTIYANL